MSQTSWHPARNVMLGAMSGLVASWVMEKAQGFIGKLGSEEIKERERAASGEPATLKAADAVAYRFGVKLSGNRRARAGKIVHYATGAAWGAALGFAADRLRIPLVLAGAAYGALVWLVNDEGLTPLLGFAKGPAAYPPSIHLKALAAHLVYGTATGGGLQAMRAL